MLASLNKERILVFVMIISLLSCSCSGTGGTSSSSPVPNTSSSVGESTTAGIADQSTTVGGVASGGTTLSPTDKGTTTAGKTPDKTNGSGTEQATQKTSNKTVRVTTSFTPSFPVRDAFTKALLDSSVVEQGNRVRIANVMRRAMNGEEITIGVFGGSITEGAGASSVGNCYGSLVADWWRKAFPQAKVNFVRAGIGATDSLFGLTRMEDELLAYDPDFMVVEFACNDDGSVASQEAYEGVVRRLLKKDIAVLLLFMSTSSYTNVQDQHIPVGKNYDLPMVSFRDAMKYMQSEPLRYGKKTVKDYLADDVHPNDAGHKMAADLVGWQLEKIYLSLNSIGKTAPALQAAVTKNRLENAVLFNASSKPAEADGWSVQTCSAFRSWKGWSPSRAGATLKIESNCSIISMFFVKQGGNVGGRAKVYVDGKAVATLEGDMPNTAGAVTATQVVFNETVAKDHTIEIVFLSEHNSNSAGSAFTLFRVLTD